MGGLSATSPGASLGILIYELCYLIRGHREGPICPLGGHWLQQIFSHLAF